MNKYSEKLRVKDTKELVEIAKSSQEFNEDYRLTALHELKERDALSDELNQIFSKLAHKNVGSEKIGTDEKVVFPKELPFVIKLAAWLAYGVFVLEIINILVFERRTYVGVGSVQIPGSTFTFVVGFFVHTGRQWARYALMVVFLFSTLGFFVLLNQMEVIGYLQQMFIAISFSLMFTSSARDFYNSRKT